MECIAAQQPYTMKILCCKLISNYLVRHFLKPNRCIRRPGPVATKHCTKALAVVISSQYDVNDLLYNVIEKYFLLDCSTMFSGPRHANTCLREQRRPRSAHVQDESEYVHFAHVRGHFFAWRGLYNMKTVELQWLKHLLDHGNWF